MPRLQACSAGLDGMQKGCVSQPGACGPAKPVPRPLLEQIAPRSLASRNSLPRRVVYEGCCAKELA